MTSISQYWHADEAPEDVAELMVTFSELNPDFRHRVFSESDAEHLIEERFGPRELAAFRACAVPSMQSDLLRYCSVLALGGIYADADYRCLRPLRPLLEGLYAGELFYGPTVHRMNGREALRVWTGFLAFREPGHPLLRLSLEIATAAVEARLPDRLWGAGNRPQEAIAMTVGPGVVTALSYMRDWGSFDAFREGIVDSFFEPFGEFFCEVVGDYDRVPAAFEGVRISPRESMIHWVADPEGPLAYKATDVHWLNHRAEIFR